MGDAVAVAIIIISIISIIATATVMPTCYSQWGGYVQEGPVLLIFIVLQLLMVTNVLVIFMAHNKRG